MMRLTQKQWKRMPWIGAAIGAAAMRAYFVPYTVRYYHNFPIAEERVPGESVIYFIIYGLMFVGGAAVAGAVLFVVLRGDSPDPG